MDRIYHSKISLLWYNIKNSQFWTQQSKRILNQQILIIKRWKKSIKPRIQLNTSKKTFGCCTRITVIFVDNREQTNDNATFLQLEQQFTRYKIDILGVSEARWLGSGVYTSPVDSNVFLYSSKEEDSARTAGVGIMLTKTAYCSLMYWEPITERFITARFHSRVRNIAIIQCYAPPNSPPIPKRTIFTFNTLQSVIRQPYAEPCHGDPRHRCV